MGIDVPPPTAGRLLSRGAPIVAKAIRPGGDRDAAHTGEAMNQDATLPL